MNHATITDCIKCTAAQPYLTFLLSFASLHILHGLILYYDFTIWSFGCSPHVCVGLSLRMSVHCVQ